MIYKVKNKQIVNRSVEVEELLHFINRHEFIEVDTETEGLDPHTCKLKSIQFGTDLFQYVLDVANITNFEELIKYIFNTYKDKIWLFANAKFDLKFFYMFKAFPLKVYDTQLAECVIYTGYNFKDENDEFYISVSLLSVAKKYLNIDLDKTIRSKINKEGLSDSVIIYAAEDVRYLNEIRLKQMGLIDKHKLNKTLELELKAVKVFARIELNGIKIKKEEWNLVAKSIDNDVALSIKDLDNVIIEDNLTKFINHQLDFFVKESKTTINWSSALQKKKLLKELNFDIDSTDERTLSKLKGKHRIISKLLNYNKLNKLKTSFGEKFLTCINPKTNRVHMDIWQIISTGRISVSKPNLNQIPSKGETAKKIRSCFIPEEGNVFVGGDYSGMELRIIAEFSQDPIWLEAFDNGEDLHSKLCSIVFNIPIENVKNESHYKKGVSYRDIQKTINFGLAYGMSKYKLADTMEISIEEADVIIKKFFKAVPRVKKLLDSLGTLAKNQGCIRTNSTYRRIRWFPEWQEAKATDNFKMLGNIERAGKNLPFQGSNGDIIKQALVNMQDFIDENNYPVKILLSVYDEIVCETTQKFAETWKPIHEQIMIDAAKTVLKRVPVVVDCKISNCWEK
jgi:DNA polymerase-1